MKKSKFSAKNQAVERAQVGGIPLKKQFGQHFLRAPNVLDRITHSVLLDSNSSIFEIGCGDGVLTRAILEQPLARLWVFEIDPDWANLVEKQLGQDKRLTMYRANILDVDWKIFEQYAPWTLLANLPYQVTFPILHLLQKNRAVLKEGVIMVQEEVAQKITSKSGRGYGFISLYFQHFFEWKLLDKVPPTAFYPPPKVDSRLLYFKPRACLDIIEQEERFWKFIQYCFKQPRRTLKNNLQQAHYAIEKIPTDILNLRAQQIKKEQFLQLWSLIS